MKLLYQSLRSYFVCYRSYLIWGIVFLLVSNFFSIYPAQVVRHAFDEVATLVQSIHQSAGEIAQTLFKYGIWIVGLAVLRGIFLFGVRQTLIVMSRHIEYEQKNELFDWYQRYSLSILRKSQTGDLMARISEDVAAVRMFTGPGIMYTLNTITLFIMVMITMLYVNAELTMYVLLPMPILSLSIFYVHSIIN
ncbi:MAG: ABC transporter transmembrane domain-containing protein, partial [Bacteroidia bacterium]|nr:ABC transporter transmembrane domain-containing protein [Bacteroidia bacterium]